LANTGGAIHGHPLGSRAGALAMRNAIDKKIDTIEYKEAISKVGTY
jgi:ribulose 1,5-bisphosphate carboxylase large subunit-like protein